MPRVLKAEVKAVADAAAVRLQQYGATANLPVPGNPPPPLREGDGDAEMALAGTGTHVVMDDAGFYALWRYVEAHALQLHNNPAPRARQPEQVFLRLVRAFRSASGQELTDEAVAAAAAPKRSWGKVKVAIEAGQLTLPPVAAAARKVWGKHS